MSRVSLCLSAAFGSVLLSTSSFSQSDDFPPINGVVALEADVLVEELIGKDGVSGSLKVVFDGMVTADEPSADPATDSARAALLTAVDKIALETSAQKDQLRIFQRLLTGILSGSDSPSRESLFALSTLYLESQGMTLSKLPSVDGTWIKSLGDFESSITQLKRLGKVSSNPNVKLALDRYQPKLEAWNERSKGYLDSVRAIQRESQVGLDSLQQQIIDSLRATIETSTNADVKTLASHSLLRLAVYGKSTAATDKFVDVARAETASADPVFLKSLENVHLVSDFKLETQDTTFDVSSVAKIVTSIVSKQNHITSTQVKFTKWIRERLVLEAFNKTPRSSTDDPKIKAVFEETFVVLDDLLQLASSRFDSSLAQEVDTTKRELFRIRFVAPF